MKGWISIKKYRIKEISAAAAAAAVTAAFIWAGKETAGETRAAVNLCLTVIIPSLYTFTVLSKLIISTNVYKLLSKPFSAVTRYVFRMPPEFFPVFAISQLAGYPIGASLICRLFEQSKISKKQAEEMLCFCIAPGPAYIMTVAQETPGAWKAVFAAAAGANLIALAATAPFRKIPPCSDGDNDKVQLDAGIFTSSVSSGAESMTVICAMILFTAAVMGILEKSGILAVITLGAAKAADIPTEQAYPFVRSFFDISNLTKITGNGSEIMPYAASLLCFGGICAHLQISSMCRGFSPVKALVCRIPLSVLAFFICKYLTPKFYTVSIIAVTAYINVDKPHMISNNQPILSIILLIMTILIISPKSMVKNKKM
ncbi:MAG: hypothetical protein NC120_00245 [Ruminococcus sp.]|nr:hypothetical protein [Ruminococcus sp.]